MNIPRFVRRGKRFWIWSLAWAAALPVLGCDFDLVGPNEEVAKELVSASGIVLDTQGAPVADVEVYMSAAGSWGLGWYSWSSPSVFTDAEGRYDTGSHELTPSVCPKVQLTLKTESHIQTVGLDSCWSHRRNITWDTERGDVRWAVMGMVQSAGAEPVIGATVQFTDWDGVANGFSDADSTATLLCIACKVTANESLVPLMGGNWNLVFTPPSTARCYDVRVTATHPDGRTLTDTINVCSRTTEHTFEF
jgi:hypothetical protein